MHSDRPAIAFLRRNKFQVMTGSYLIADVMLLAWGGLDSNAFVAGAGLSSTAGSLAGATLKDRAKGFTGICYMGLGLGFAAGGMASLQIDLSYLWMPETPVQIMSLARKPFDALQVFSGLTGLAGTTALFYAQPVMNAARVTMKALRAIRPIGRLANRLSQLKQKLPTMTPEKFCELMYTISTVAFAGPTIEAVRQAALTGAPRETATASVAVTCIAFALIANRVSGLKEEPKTILEALPKPIPIGLEKPTIG